MFYGIARGPFFAVFLLMAFSSNLTWAQSANKEAILQNRADFLTYYQSGDVDKIMEQYHDNATFAGTLGPFWLIGKDAIRTLWANYFGAWPERSLSFRGQKGLDAEPEMFFFNDDTMSVEVGYMLMYMGPVGGPPVVTNIRYSITRAKEGADWLIVNMNVSRIPGQ